LPGWGRIYVADERFAWYLENTSPSHLLRTGDGGLTWEPITPKTASATEARQAGETPPTIDLPKDLAPIVPGPLDVVAQVRLERPTALTVSSDGESVLVGQANGQVTEWPLNPGEFPTVLARHSDWVYDAAYDSYDRVASASKDGTIRVWSRHELTAQWTTVTGHSGVVSAVEFSPDGSRLASASQDGTVRLWEADWGLDEVLRLQADDSWVWDIAFSPDGSRLASASEDRTAKLWDVATGALLRTLSGHTSTVSSVAFSADGSTLATASWDGTVRLWDVASGSAKGTLSGHTDWIYDVAFSPAGDLLASASGDGTVILWDPSEAQSVAVLEHGARPVRKLAFTPDGRLLVTISDDGWVRFWGMAD
jgi:WD40 repeat protein